MNIERTFGAAILCVAAATSCGGTVNTVSRGGAEESGGAGGATHTGSGGKGSGGVFVGSGGAYGGAGYGAYGGFYTGAGGVYDGYGGYYGYGGAVPAGGTAGIPGCIARPPLDPGQDVPEYGPCGQTPSGATGICETAGEASLHPLHKLLGHAECAGALVCVPNVAYLDGGFASPSCSTTMGLGGASHAGACLPRAAAAGWALSAQLRREQCDADAVCIPCTEPLHGDYTGACFENPVPPIQQCGQWDSGPSGGYCIPQETVDVWNLPMSPILKQDECATGSKCVPAQRVENPRACAARCTTTLASFGDQYGPGACVPSYIVRDVNPTGLAILTQGTCAFGEFCTPCLDPLNNGVTTHMCE